MHLSKNRAQKRPNEVSLNKSQHPRADFQLKGFWLHTVRGAWIAFLVAELIVIIIPLFGLHGSPLTICAFPTNCAITSVTAQALHRAGIASASYMTFNLVLALLQSLVFLGMAGLIFWRKSREPFGLAASFVFMIVGLSPFINGSSAYTPGVVFGYIYAFCLMPTIGFFLVTFPDGRFVPRWSWAFAALWLVLVILFEIPTSFNITFWPPPLFIAELLLTFGGTIGLLIYRYMRIFSYSQRQQTKWLVFGLAGFVALNFLFGLIGGLSPGLSAADSPYQLVNGPLMAVTFLILPLSVGIAIQRTRLWDIDVIVRRTLIYTTLTVILALIYVGIVIALGALLRGLFGQQQQNPVVIVASTLVIAALFTPLRHGVQRVIDRRFYRRRYDAAQTLSTFSATLRNEIDLEQLREELVAVVSETTQPSHVWLWVPPAKPDKTQQSAWRSTPHAPKAGE